MMLFESLKADALIVTSGTNRRYFSGWSAEDHAPDRPAGVMLITSTERLLLASPTNLPWAESECLPEVTPVPMLASWPTAISELIRARNLQRIAFEDAVTPVAAWRHLTEVLGDGVELIEAGDKVDATRRQKSPREIGLIREALAITDDAFNQAAAHLGPGMTERELGKFIDETLGRLGSDGNAFDTIVASGPNAAKPHHAPGDRVIEAGDPVIIDMGARVQGYCGDLTRTVWMGQPTDQLGTMYRLVAKAQRAAIAAVRGKVPAEAIDQAARQVFAQADMEQYFVHSVGHAIGLRIHEDPFLRTGSSDELQVGNVVTIEPGLYIPDWGGVRIEDVVLVTEDGCENLTGAPKLQGE